MSDTAIDIIVCDEEYEFAAKKIDEYCNYLCGVISDYCLSLDMIMQDAIVDNKIDEKIKNIVVQMRLCQTKIERVGKEVPVKCRQYIKDIDKADSFLY